MDKKKDKSDAVPLGPKLIASGGFDLLYREGMALIEEVAAYLDGQGRTDSRALAREASFTYATESMRLTTRLMQLASWLLLHRAVNEGEITSESARVEKEKVRFSQTPEKRGGPGWEDLPQALTDYITKGDRLFVRVQQFDKLERGDISDADEDTRPVGGVADQISQLHSAFGIKEGDG